MAMLTTLEYAEGACRHVLRDRAGLEGLSLDQFAARASDPSVLLTWLVACFVSGAAREAELRAADRAGNAGMSDN